MKKIFVLFGLFSFLLGFTQKKYHFKTNEGKEENIYLLFKNNIKQEYKPIKTIRTKFSSKNVEENTFEYQLNYLANLCLNNGGNSMWIKWIQNIGEPDSFVMSAYIYHLPDNEFSIKEKENEKTELIVYRPKYYNGLGAEFSKLEIFINGKPLNLKKGTVFNMEKPADEEFYLEIPKHKIKEKIKINEGEKNYLKFMLYQNIPKGNTLYPNQIIIPLGKVFPVFDLVSEVQADIEIDNF